MRRTNELRDQQTEAEMEERAAPYGKGVRKKG